MLWIEMYAEIQKIKKLGYKKQRAARELDIDTKTVPSLIAPLEY